MLMIQQINFTREFKEEGGGGRQDPHPPVWSRTMKEENLLAFGTAGSEFTWITR